MLLFNKLERVTAMQQSASSGMDGIACANHPVDHDQPQRPRNFRNLTLEQRRYLFSLYHHDGYRHRHNRQCSISEPGSDDTFTTRTQDRSMKL
jgi:hypothetical protein